MQSRREFIGRGIAALGAAAALDPRSLLAAPAPAAKRILILGGTGFVGGDLVYQDDQQNRLRPTDPTYREIGSHTVVNLRFGVDSENGWSAIAGVNNVFDEDETITYTFNGNSQPNVGYVPPGEVRPWPRTFFISARRSF